MDDTEIIREADAWEKRRSEESARRFNLIFRFVKSLVLLLLTGVAVWGVLLWHSHAKAEASERELAVANHTRLRAEEHTRVYRACLREGLGDTCGCLWDSNVCLPHALATCREHLPPALCECLTNPKLCVHPSYQQCLVTMSEKDCRCLVDVQLCVPNEE